MANSREVYHNFASYICSAKCEEWFNKSMASFKTDELMDIGFYIDYGNIRLTVTMSELEDKAD